MHHPATSVHLLHSNHQMRSHLISSHVFDFRFASWYTMDPCVCYNQLHGIPKTQARLSDRPLLRPNCILRVNLSCVRNNSNPICLQHIQRPSVADKLSKCSCWNGGTPNLDTSTGTLEIWSFFSGLTIRDLKSTI